jgi:hypothetical protein
VARETRTPLILTGSNIATGVTVPVLPTWNSTQSNLVVTSSAGNLYAIAHLGLFAFSPRILLNLKSFTFITTPSDSKGNSLCFEYMWFMCSIASFIPLTIFHSGTTLNPQFLRFSSSSF